MAKTDRAHLHHYDVHPNNSTMAACLDCGFSVPVSALTSRVNLDAIIARENATPRLRDLVNLRAQLERRVRS